jgi:hypothetical protein
MMESNVKFKQIAVVREASGYYGEILGLSEDGDIWQLVRNGEDDWNKVAMPMDWQKELDNAIASYESLKGNALIARTTMPPIFALGCSNRIAHAAFMLHPELREK